VDGKKSDESRFLDPGRERRRYVPPKAIAIPLTTFKKQPT